MQKVAKECDSHFIVNSSQAPKVVKLSILAESAKSDGAQPTDFEKSFILLIIDIFSACVNVPEQKHLK